MKFSDIIIIGAGAAGLMAASGAGNHNSGKDLSITILEKMPRPGRKIMITGKGRCNFTNLKDWNEFSGHIHPKPNLLKPAFHNLTSEKMMDFLNENGLETVVERGDRAFPASHLSKDVVDALVRAAKKGGAEILCEKEVTEIRAEEDGKEKFIIECADGSTYSCNRLIITTGGLSYPTTGSTGDGYRWAKDFGITLRPCFPSLTAVVPKNYKTTPAEQSVQMKGHIDRSTPLSEAGNMLKGIQLKNVGLCISVDGNTVQEEFGDLDFTDGGIEGPIGFKISRRCVNAIVNGSKVAVSIDLKPAVELNELEERVSSLWKQISEDRRSQGKQYKDKFNILLRKLLPYELVPGFMNSNPSSDHKRLGKALKNWKFDIGGFVGYERCVITAGGVSSDEITAKTLESKKIQGLYFAGEILDLDADTGGYNLQIAFSTGYLAGMSAAKSIVQE